MKSAHLEDGGSHRLIILASKSPRRIAMLQKLGLMFVSSPQDIDETANGSTDPGDHVLRLACEKVEEAVKAYKAGTLTFRTPEEGEIFKNFEKTSHNSHPVFLGADTVVVHKDKLMGKPGSRNEGREMLSLLSGTRHEVITGYCIRDDGGVQICNAIKTRVLFRTLEPSEIQDYLDKGEWTDKAGSYGIQGSAAFMVESVFGSYTNVVGLPLAEVTRDLRKMGAMTRLFSDKET